MPQTHAHRFARLDVQLRAAPGLMPDTDFDQLVSDWLNAAKDFIATPAAEPQDVAAKLVTLARLVAETGGIGDRDR
jgi:hypothetical protein